MTSGDIGSDPGLEELLGRYEKWRQIYAYAGKPAMDEPYLGSGRLLFRAGYPFPGWTAYVIEAKDGGYNVLRATTERRNEPLETLRGFFSSLNDAGKYVISNIGDSLRIDLRIDPIYWTWEDSGLDPRVIQTSVGQFVSKFELKENPSRYFVLQAGGIQPENQLLPLTYDELDELLVDGLPDSILSRLGD
jgi:hypothetical protein